MKYSIVIILLAFSGLCFKPADDPGTFFATVDGKMFKVQNNLFRGTLIKKSGNMNGKSEGEGKTVISTSFNGPTYDKSDKTAFTENVSFDISYEDGKTGEPEGFTTALQFASNDYVMVKDHSKLKISRFAWEPDHKHFRISADFDCLMRSWGYPNDNKKDITLKGHMTNILITVPSWFATTK